MISQGGIRGLLAKYFRHLVPVGVLLLAGLLPLTWFGPGKIINGGDTFWPLDPTDSIARIVSIWDPRVGAGSDAGLRAGDLFPFLFVLRLVQWLGLSSVTGQAIWFCLLMIASGLGMYVLAVASLEAEWSHWGGLIGGLFYQFNPYTVKAWATGHQNLLLGYAMLPLGAMLVARGLKQSPVKNGALLALLTLWMAPLSSNPALYLVIVMGFLLAMAGLLVCDPTSRNLRKVATFGLVFGGLWLLANAWWLAALAEYAHAYAGQANVREVAARTELAGPLQAHTSFLELLKLQGYFGFYGAHKGEPYMLFAEEFVRPPTTLAILTMVGIALSTLVWARSRKTAALAVAVYLIGLLLVKGMHTPLGVLMAELYQRVPGFWLYRDSYTKFLPLAVAALGYLITLVATELGHRPALQRLGATVGLIGLIGFGAWPLLRGDVIRPAGGVIPGFRLTVPDYYSAADNFVRAQSGHFRLFLLPQGSGYIKYRWGYAGGDLFPLLVRQPQLLGGGEDTVRRATLDLQDLVFESLNLPSESDPSLILRLLGVKYVVERRDVDWTYYDGTADPEAVEQALQTWGLVLEKSIGELDFYRLDAPVPHVYASLSPETVYKARSLTDPDLVQRLRGDLLPFLLVENGLSETTRTRLRSEFEEVVVCRRSRAPATEGLPLLAINALSPTTFRITAESSCPFFLIFSESFHPGWRATVRVDQEPALPLVDHFVANGYANGWYVSRSGRYTIVLEFVPQRLFEIGVFISTTTLIACMTYLIASVAHSCALKQLRRSSRGIKS